MKAAEVTDFIDSIKQSVLGTEITLPICSLPRRKPIHVLYTYYQNKPLSHQLEFLKGKRSTFGIFLPRPRENVAQLCSIVENQEYRTPGGESAFGFWQRVLLRFSLGTLVSSRDLFDGPASNLHTTFGETDSRYQYRLAYGQKGAEEAILLVSSRHSRHSGPYRKSARTEFNWIRLSLSEYRDLADHLRLFLKSDEFLEIETAQSRPL